MKKVFALVDCNNFYVSCERVFNPKLQGVPVVVLSNNDGCAISRSEEAKELGIQMGAPMFKLKELVKQTGTQVLSSNYTLYGDMSARVMSTLGEFSPEMEIYSIDEAFLMLEGIPGDLTEFSYKVRSTVMRNTGIPVSIGIGETKTLAKAANKIAKKNKLYNGVFNMIGPAREPALSFLPVSSVWGIGRKHAAFLEAKGIRTALDFVHAPETLIKKHMTISGLHTQMELKGISCSSSDAAADKKIITRSRSFGHTQREFEPICEAVSEFAARAAEKLREYKLAATNVHVFIETNTFLENEPQYMNTAIATTSYPVSYTPEIIRFATDGLKKIFRKGYAYKKAGVMLTGLLPEDQLQMDLFLKDRNFEKNKALMKTVDNINARFGSNTMRYAEEGFARTWKMRQENLSGRFTTSWTQIPVVKAG